MLTFKYVVSKLIFVTKASLAKSYKIFLFPEISNPAPSVDVAFVALLANNIVLSLMSTIVELIIVVLPSTIKLPLIVTVPLLLSGEGLIIKLDGPFSSPVNVKLFKLLLISLIVTLLKIISPQIFKFCLNIVSEYKLINLLVEISIFSPEASINNG